MNAAKPCALNIVIHQNANRGQPTPAAERAEARRRCRCPRCVAWRREQKR